MKKQIPISILAGMLLLCGCANQNSLNNNTPSSTSAERTSATVTTTATDETTAKAATTAAPKYDYVHGADSYYNLAEELKYFKMPMQYSGTCWLFAASASMRSAYEKKTGKELDINVPDLLERIYGADKQEGIILRKEVDQAALGGYQGFVTERLSRDCKDGITLDSSMIIDPSDRETIKNAIKTRGGVVVVIDDWSVEKGLFGGYLTVNYDHAEKYDHDVTLIGWDDHFPKEYFQLPAAQDGAWIAYNSNSGERYYYISYCSPFEQAVSHTVSDEYSEVICYDAGNEMDTYIKIGDSTKAANVFHKKGMLAAVGTFNDFDKQDITIEIMSADFKNVLYTQDAALDYYGYHTVQLTNPVEVVDFAVVITYTKGAPVEGESIDTVAGSYKTTIEKGQSFVFADGKWKDMTDSDINSVLETAKGKSLLFNDNGAFKEYLTDSDMESMLKTDFEPGNFCIKALFLK